MAPRVVESIAAVLANEAVNAEYRRLDIELDRDVIAAVLPGQFFNLLCGGGPAFLRRPMSVYATDAAAGVVSFLYRVVGSGTAALAALEPGDQLNVVGPLGRAFTLPHQPSTVVVLARGTGLATLAPLAATARTRGHRVTAILSARRIDLLDGIAEMGGHDGEVHALSDEDGSSHVTNVERLLRRTVVGSPGAAIYVCGSRRLLRAAQSIASEFGIGGEVALEQQMACGLGMCFCCVRPFRHNEGMRNRRVCWEGPVFDIAEAVA
jgi:dihydroorotate dehydrogenase electron transfer subunit